MSALKYAMGVLAAGAAMGAGASHAGTIITDNTVYQGFTNGTQFSYDITLGGASDPQFNYNGGEQFVNFGDGAFPIGVKNFLNAYDTARLSPIAYTTDALPSAGETFFSTQVQTYPTAADPWYHLDFFANGVEYLGTAHINDNQALDQIRYESLADIRAGVPEPASWALMILGAGAAGVALRRSRRNQPAVAAR